MLPLAFWLLCAAAAAGAGLAVQYVKGPAAKRPPAAIPLAHAAFGVAGLAALLLALRTGPPKIGLGTAGFAPIAAGLLGCALALGLLLAHASWRRRRPSELLVGAHAGLAVAGLVLLLALVALG